MDDPSIVPNECWGRFPSGNYDIGFDEGAWNHLSRKVYGTFTDLSFQGARTSTALALWLVEWAYAFGVQDRLGGPAVDVARQYQSDVIGPLGLGHLAWTYAVAWAAIAGLRGRLTMAAGELAISVLAAGLAGILLANPAGYMQGTTDTMSRLSGAAPGDGNRTAPTRWRGGCRRGDGAAPSRDPCSVRRGPLRLPQLGRAPLRSLRRHAQRDPRDYPHGADDHNRDMMRDAGCDAQAEFNSSARTATDSSAPS